MCKQHNSRERKKKTINKLNEFVEGMKNVIVNNNSIQRVLKTELNKLLKLKCYFCKIYIYR